MDEMKTAKNWMKVEFIGFRAQCRYYSSTSSPRVIMLLSLFSLFLSLLLAVLYSEQQA